jgi:D-3-phosphoglycerate dehydrogenase
LRVGLRTDFLRERFGSAPWPEVPELKDLTLGILGLGRIGGALALKTKGLFRRVLAHDPYIPLSRFAALGATNSSLEELLSRSDVVSLHSNLTDETRGLLCERTLGLLRPQAVLINTSRGPVVDEEALLRALESGRLQAAGLDCFEDEPPLSNRDALLTHPRVVATGHYAWYSVPASRELQRHGGENMAALLEGRIPEDCLNP